LALTFASPPVLSSLSSHTLRWGLPLWRAKAFAYVLHFRGNSSVSAVNVRERGGGKKACMNQQTRAGASQPDVFLRATFDDGDDECVRS